MLASKRPAASPVGAKAAGRGCSSTSARLRMRSAMGSSFGRSGGYYRAEPERPADTGDAHANSPDPGIALRGAARGDGRLQAQQLRSAADAGSGGDGRVRRPAAALAAEQAGRK